MNRHRLAIFGATNLRTSTGSVNTIVNLLDNLDETNFQIDIVLIDNLVVAEFKIAQDELLKDPSYVPFSEVKRSSKVNKIIDLEDLSLREIRDNYDAAIVAIYNSYGEDGKILGLLEVAGVPYLSPSLKTSAICLDKTMTKLVLKGNGILVPEGFEIDRGRSDWDEINNKIQQELGYPVIVKTVSSGASRGIGIARNSEELEKEIRRARVFSDEVIVEQLLVGEEFTVGVMGDYPSAKALPVVMIKTENSFFDYEAKYALGKADEICPAPIDDQLKIDLQNLALAAYSTVKCSSHARIDIIKSGEKLYVLEINTFPGLTKSSIFPKELTAAGMSLRDFLTSSLNKLINSSG